MSENRIQGSYSARVSAADAARSRPYPDHQSNGEEQRYSGAKFAMSFTKGLKHDENGLVECPEHYIAFRQAIDDGEIDAFNNRVPVGSFPDNQGTERPRRKWEAPTAGVVYDLQGPDCQAVTMAPAPDLCSDELAFEMAEVYELACLRDVSFQFWDKNGGNTKLKKAIERLNALPYAKHKFPVRPRKNEDNVLTYQTVFRGSSPGVEQGPYISQFLLIGTNGLGSGETIDDGFINYGAIQISQKVAVADDKDYMTNFDDWLEVQNGLDVNGSDPGQDFTGARRFIHTPRDLATYVHFDALYEAYLNACLILLDMKTPFDPAFATLSGMRKSFPASSGVEGRQPNAGGFALYGGPHILSLVTEVATRALKAARYQKFNVHNRARPEVLAARIHKRVDLEKYYPQFCECLTKMHEQIKDTVDAIEAVNGVGNALLPMAFKEGSPMHPSYAAGHATVAGACVTVLKAFFDTGTAFVDDGTGARFRHEKHGDEACAYVSKVNGTQLDKEVLSGCALTLEGELNKLAANISIGRNMAGVHYFSDYYDSLRMGEEIAIGLLEEQALCYPTDPFVMSLNTFDGKTIRIGAR